MKRAAKIAALRKFNVHWARPRSTTRTARKLEPALEIYSHGWVWAGILSVPASGRSGCHALVRGDDGQLVGLNA
jgi:hypothetical protein